MYVIQANWQSGKNFLQGYLQIDTLTFFSTKKGATSFTSKVLANGWILKAETLYPNYQFTLIKT